MAIVEERVKPDRSTKDAVKYPRMVHEWWKFFNARPELQAATLGLERVAAISCHGQHSAFAFLPAEAVFSHGLVVFPVASHAAFCAMQSRVHEMWARFFGSSIKDDLRYTPSDCFQTFPFPEDWETDAALEAAGEAYYDFRAALMVRNGEGLTKTYNRFHDPHERDPEVDHLRGLHDEMDRAVLHAYGWDDIPTGCEFILDYEVDEADSGRRKKPWRYRWPDDVRDEVLASLVELNAERAAAERRAGPAGTGRSRAGGGARSTAAVQSKGLF